MKVKIKKPQLAKNAITKEKIELGGVKGTRYRFKFNIKGATKIMFEYSKKKNKGYKKSKFSSFYVKEGNVRYFRAIAYYGKQRSPYTKVVKIKG